MRVLFWAETFWPQIGGVEVLASELVLALQERGHEILIVTRQDSEDLAREDNYQGIRIVRLPFRSAMTQRDIDQLLAVRQQVIQLKRTFQPHLMHINHVGPGLLFNLETASAWRVPTLFALHQTLPTDAVRPNMTLGRILRAVNWITTCSRAVLRDTQSQVPAIQHYSSVIENALPLPGLKPAALPFQPANLLCIGRFVPQKGFDVALRAFAILCEQFPDLRLRIAGDGSERPALEALATALRLRDKVDFLGWIGHDQTAALMNTTTLVLMPSRFEPFGLVALQAAQMARPIVATHVDGLVEVVVSGETGLLVPPEDRLALAEATADLLIHPDKASAMGQAARRRATKHFRWQDYVDAYDALYHRLAEEQP